jgi:hypothetical protein
MALCEDVVQFSFLDWGVFRSNVPISGPLILTNKRLIFGNKENSIKLDEIKFVQIDTHLAAAPSILLYLFNDTFESLSFVRLTSGHLVTVLLGDTGWAQTEVAAYASYWAALITFTKYQSESRMTLDELDELFVQAAKKLEPKEVRAWCMKCKRYVTVMKKEEVPIYSVRCPECNGVMVSKSPEDRGLQPS